MNSMILAISIFVILFCVSLYVSSKPRKEIVSKYGQPIAHFSTRKCWNTMPIKSTNIDMDFYDEFIIISDKNAEYCMRKDFKQYEIIGSYLRAVLEIELNNQKIQIDLTRRQKKLLQKFFE